MIPLARPTKKGAPGSFEHEPTRLAVIENLKRHVAGEIKSRNEALRRSGLKSPTTFWTWMRRAASSTAHKAFRDQVEALGIAIAPEHPNGSTVKREKRNQPLADPGNHKVTQVRVRLVGDGIRGKLSDARTQAEILTALRDGVSVNGAARLAGVDPRRVREWVQKGLEAPDDEPNGYTEFAIRVGQARGLLERDLVTSIRKGVGGRDVMRHQWLLERLFADEWIPRKPEVEQQAQRVVIELKGADGNVIDPQKL